MRKKIWREHTIVHFCFHFIQHTLILATDHILPIFFLSSNLCVIFSSFSNILPRRTKPSTCSKYSLFTPYITKRVFILFMEYNYFSRIHVYLQIYPFCHLDCLTFFAIRLHSQLATLFNLHVGAHEHLYLLRYKGGAVLYRICFIG